MPRICAAACEHRKSAAAPICSGVANSSEGCFSPRSLIFAVSGVELFPGDPIVDLLLHERRQHPAGADRVAGDSGGRGLERHDFRQAEDAVLRRDVGRLLRRRDQAMGRGDVDDPSPIARLHVRQGGADGVKRGREVDRDDRIPLLDRKLLDRRDVLDAGIVHEDVHPAQLARGLRHHRRDLGGLRHVGRAVVDLHLVLRPELGDELVDLRLVAEAVQHHVRSGGGEGARDAKADAARRAGHQRDFAGEAHHFVGFVMFGSVASGTSRVVSEMSAFGRHLCRTRPERRIAADEICSSIRIDEQCVRT